VRNVTEVKAELDSFKTLWQGGYYAGDPRDPTFALWGITSFLGVSYAIYLGCVKPYVKPSTTVLEIGCGRGAWTKLMLQSKEIFCLDALSAEHNGFYEYVGSHDHVHYIKVDDFLMKEIPLETIDFTFSYDSLCHVSFASITEYASSLFPRMRLGGNGIWMVADYHKYNFFLENQQRFSALNFLLPRRCYPMVRRALQTIIVKFNTIRYRLRTLDINEDSVPRPGRWYHAGTKRTCEMLESVGFTIVDPDMGFDFRSPIIHFRK